ncbi:MAG TPA: hypothetical protein VGH55_04345 [Chthoniobacterales bacterium]
MGESYLTLVRKPDAGKLHVRFDERDLETGHRPPRQISTLRPKIGGARLRHALGVLPENVTLKDDFVLRDKALPSRGTRRRHHPAL